MPISLGVAQGEINISTRGADAAERRVASASRKMQGDLSGIGKGVGGLQDKFRQLDSFLGASFLVGAAVGFGKINYDLGKSAAQADVTERAFQKLARGVGLAGDEILEGMRKTSRGTITDAALILGANRAIVSGIADSGAELNQILEIARATGQAFGFSTEDAFEKIVRGVSKLEPELLDELGIMVRLDDLFRSYAASIGTTAAKLNEAQRRQALLNEVVRQTKPAVDAAAGAGDQAIDKYGRLEVATDKLGKSWGKLLNAAGGPTIIDAITGAIDQDIARLESYVFLLEKLLPLGRGIRSALGMSLPSAAPAFNVGTRTANMSNRTRNAAPARFDDAQTGIIRDHYDAVTEMERSSLEDRRDAISDYAENVADAERDYHLSSSREAQDFGISRVRAEADFAAQIADLHADAARREADQLDDFNRANTRADTDSAESIAEARADAGERLVELEDKYNKAREKAALDHRDKLMDAAGRLDAQAVYEEQRNFARESKDAAEAHDEQRAELGEQLAERIADEQEALAESNADRREAYERQLQDGRENDALREGEMVAEFAKRKALEDEDRALKLARAAADYAASQAEMARQHALDLERIRQEAAAERLLLKEEADKKLAAADFVNAEFDKRDRARTDAAIANWDRMGRAALAASAGQSYRAGERAAYTPTITPTPAWMTGASRDTPSSRTYVVQPGALIVNVPPSDRSIADIAVREIMEFFESLTEGQPQ